MLNTLDKAGIQEMSLTKIYKMNKDLMLYLFFGICTTLVNLAVYWGMAHRLRAGTMESTIVAWFMAVLFAYVTNRKWVFHSEASGQVEIVREIISFFGCRMATGGVDWGCMFIFVDVLRWNDMIIKFLANLAVIILNYVSSKFLIFKKDGNVKGV